MIKITLGERAQNKWALVLLPAPTAPDRGGPLLQEQFSPVSGVRLADVPEGPPSCLTAFGFPPGVDLCGEALIRTWRMFSGSNPAFRAPYASISNIPTGYLKDFLSCYSFRFRSELHFSLSV